jgi:hypothetical protein
MMEFSNAFIAVSSPVETCVSNSSNMYDSLHLNRFGLSREAFEYGIRGFNYLEKKGKLNNDQIITIIDFSKPSAQKRLFILDIKKYKLLCTTWVAHGMRSGLEYASHFSNTPESNQSSLGFYETGGTYEGKNGFSMKLQGLENGFNSNAESRDIVMHAAPYVTAEMARERGFIGRSQGCPAVPLEMHKQIIDRIKGGSCLFIYGPDNNYLSHSRIINS